ncbi:MAG: ABC transporter permease [Nitrososphaerota archaeon]|nr:ABC transporter permease [Nitrososphaerota archaeon]
MSLPVRNPEALSEKLEEEVEGKVVSGTEEIREPSQSLFRQVIRALRRDKIAMFGLAVIILVAVTAIFAKEIAPYDPNLQQLSGAFKGPSSAHLLGQDELGRDLLSRIIYGSRVSMAVGASVVSVSIVIGVLLGAISGYYGGKTDIVIMRFVDVFLSFPGIILAVGAVAIVGPGLENVIIALIVINWPGYTRVMRGEVLKIKQNPYVLASKGMGASNFWILRKHIIPGAISPVVVLGTIGFGWAVLAEAGLSFLGLGVQPPTPSWGGMVAEGLSYILEDPNIALFGGLAIAITVLCFNMLGDGLRDALDPSLRI